MNGCPHGMPTPGSCTECMAEGNLTPADYGPPKAITAERTFSNRYETDCATCEFPIPVGGTVTRWSDGRYRHPGLSYRPRTERGRRIEAQRRAMGWGGSYALVRRPPTCSRCDGPLVVTTWHQDALLRHGGHGATLTTTRTACARCGPLGYEGTVHRTETAPPRRLRR